MPAKTAHLKKPKVVEQPLNKYAKVLFEELNFNTSTLKMQNQPYNRGIKDMFEMLNNEDEVGKELKFKTMFPSLENHTTISLQKYATFMQG